MDDHSITPRRALPPVPPPGRQSGTATLAPAVDQTSWFDPLDPMNDSAVHAAFTGLDPLDDGTAAKAARDLIRESGRQPVLDQALLEALDAAAKAAEARRAVTLAVPPTTAAAPAVVVPRTVPPVLAAAPATVADRPVAPVSGPIPVPMAAPAAAPVPAAPALDISAEFARHDDLVETGRHASVADEWVYDSGPQAPMTDTGRHLALQIEDDEDDVAPAALTHRTVVTRSSGRRWIPVGVGVGVAAIVGAVLLTSGFGADAGSAGTDEAARTGASTSEPATPAATTPALPPPAMNTLDLSGPVVVDDSVDVSQPTVPSGRSSAAVQPQVATPPTTRTSTAQAPSGGGSGSSEGSGTVETMPSTLTATTTTTEPSSTPTTSASTSTSGESSTSAG